MKKIFTLITMTLLAVGGVNAQTQLTLGGQAANGNWSWGWNQTFGAKVNLVFTGAWGEFNLATTGLTEGASYKLVVAEANAKVNLVIKNKVEDNNSYIAIDKTEITGTIPADATKIELQGTEANLSLEVLSFEINGTQTAYSTNWGVAFLGSLYKSSSAWAELFLNGAEGKANQKLTINANAPIPADLQLKLYITEKLDDKGEVVKDGDNVQWEEGYIEVPSGEKTATVTIEKAYKAVSLQAKAKDLEIDIASVVVVEDTSTGIDAVKTGVQKQDGVRYNLAGQKVSDSYKGIVIVNGKKVVVK